MIVNGFCFNSSNRDRLYTADSLTDYFALFVGNGVFLNKGSALRVQANPDASGLSVIVNPGAFFIDGKAGISNSVITLQLASSHATLGRRDRIVARLNMTNRVMEIVVNTGTAAAQPVAPSLSRLVDSIYELSLAEVTVGAASTSLTQSNIIDTRSDSRVCGFVTGLVDQLDTSELSTQWTTKMQEDIQAFENSLNSYLASSKTSFDSWFTNIRATLESIDLTQLMARQDAVEAKLDKIIAYDYYAANQDDNLALNSLVADFYAGRAPFVNGVNAQAVIRVHGVFRGDAVGSDYSLDIAPAGPVTKRLVVDFSDCPMFATHSLRVAQATIRNLNVRLTSNKTSFLENALMDECRITTVAGSEAINCYNAEFNKCEITCSGNNATLIGLKGSGIRLNKCSLEVTAAAGSAKAIHANDVLSIDSDVVAVSGSTSGLGTGAGAFGYYADDNSYYRIIGGSVRAYAIASALLATTNPSEAAGAYIPASMTSAMISMIGVNLPHVVRSGYADHSSLGDAGKARLNAVKLNSGRYLLTSCTMFKEPLLYRLAPDWDNLITLLQTACTSSDTSVASNNAATFVNTIKGLQQSNNMSWGTQVLNLPGNLL